MSLGKDVYDKNGANNIHTAATSFVSKAKGTVKNLSIHDSRCGIHAGCF